MKVNKKTDQDKDEAVYVRLSDIPYDLMRYTISMKSGAERREARKNLLLKMGAIPPKNKFVNYKEIMKNRADAKQKSLEHIVDRAATSVNKQIPLFKKKDKSKKGGSKKLKKDKRRERKRNKK